MEKSVLVKIKFGYKKLTQPQLSVILSVDNTHKHYMPNKSNKFERHIKEVCKKHEIQLKIGNKFDADLLFRVLTTPKRISTIKDYVLALHEIGHIICEGGSIFENMHRYQQYSASTKTEDSYYCNVSRWIFQSERDAWVMAGSLAKWWSHAANKTVLNALTTYIVHYNHFHKQPIFNIPTEKLIEHVTTVVDDEDDTYNVTEEFLLRGVNSPLIVEEWTA